MHSGKNPCKLNACMKKLTIITHLGQSHLNPSHFPLYVHTHWCGSFPSTCPTSIVVFFFICHPSGFAKCVTVLEEIGKKTKCFSCVCNSRSVCRTFPRKHSICFNVRAKSKLKSKSSLKTEKRYFHS